MELDLKLTGGTVLTMDGRRPIASSVGIWQGRIAGVDAEIEGLPARRTVDLTGKTVLPGFVDAHTHLLWTGTAMRATDVGGVTTREGILEVIERAASAAAPGAWVDVTGYDHRPLGAHLTRDDLDRVANGRLVYVRHVSGHVCVVSSAVLDGTPPERLAAAGSGLVRDASGRPTGLLEEAAMSVARDARLPYPVSELVDALESSATQALAEGVTFCAEAGIGAGLGTFSPVELAVYQQAWETGRLPLRTQLMVSSEVLHPLGAHAIDGITRGLDLGLRSGFGADRLSVGAVKAWLDGGMMARTAALTEPYEGMDTAGALAEDLEELRELLIEAHVAGWQLAIHAIGDRAVDAALDIVEAAQHARPRPEARHRIEHAGLVRPDQLPRMAAAGLTAVIQPSFLYFFGDDYARVMGEKRSPWMYRGRAFLDHGIALAGSSDRPVAVGAPLRAMQFMVERRSSGGGLIGPEEAISVEEALHAYTMGGARACGVDDRLGSVTAGKLADLTVLGEDPRRVPADRIADVPVVATLVGGEFAYER
ncbi:amidohydrolase [Nonomuraea polychroma]|uniref:amidohydrolase n=1 Tax=Nonomuraea polychroma TaxID=46176 RepID=UPI003D905E62